MSRTSLAPRSKSPKPTTVVPIRPPMHLAVLELDELTDVARRVRLLDLAMQGLDAMGSHSMIDMDTHLEPLVFAVGDLHTAVYKLEQRLAGMMIQISRETAKSA